MQEITLRVLQYNNRHLATLLRHTNRLSTATSRLGMLTTDTGSPDMSETPVCSNLLQTLQVITQLRIDSVRQELRIFAIDNVLLPIQKPQRDLELRWVLHDIHNAL
jgi:hypothetical protein